MITQSDIDAAYSNYNGRYKKSVEKKERYDKCAECGGYKQDHPSPTCGKFVYQRDNRPSGLDRLRAIKFVAWDSEGCNLNGKHRLTYLANSRSEELFIDPSNPNHAAAVIPFLFAHGKRQRDVVHVFYYASYDWTMFLKGLEVRELRRIYEAGGNQYTRIYSVRPQEPDCYYEISTLKRKSFRIRVVRVEELYIEGKGIVKHSSRLGSAMFLDCSAFYQQSFVMALTSNLGADYSDLELIKSGKARRGESSSLTEEDRSYCQAELRALVKLMNKLRDELVAANIPVRNFWGAGAIASTLLSDNGMKVHLGSREKDRAAGLENVFVHAFAGARIEMCRYGHHQGKLYDYDLASCYPSIIATLPSFDAEHGKWVHHQSISADAFRSLSPYSVAFVLYEGKSDAPFYPLFHRHINKSIFFPRRTAGWKHYSEILAALDAPGVLACNALEIREAWEWVPNDNAPSPWRDFVLGKYALRADLKSRYGKDGPEKVLKLGLNALYGKLAQRIGWTKGREEGDEPRMPTYQHLYASGYVTAMARARLYRRTWRDPFSVISFATDGLTATSELHNPNELDLNSGNLGSWELKHYSEGLFVQAGVYWLGNPEVPDDKPKCQTRGFRMPGDAHHFRDVIAAAWERGYVDLHVPTTVFYASGLALARQDPEQYYGEWSKIPRRLALTCLGPKRKINGKSTPYKGLVSTLPREPGEIGTSLLLEEEKGEWWHGEWIPYSEPSPAEWLDDWGGKEEFEIMQGADIAADYSGVSFNTAGV